MKILVPVDGSTHSMEALKVAIDYALTKGASISVVSVVTLIGGLEDHELSPSRREGITAALELKANDALKKACDAVAAANLSACTATIIQSVSVPDAIIEAAEKEKADLIVMGSRGMNASSRFAMGSVATQVVKYSACSVYVVKLPSGASA